MPSTEIITAAQAAEAELRTHANRINETIDLIANHESAFEEATLEPRLLIGLEIAKAQEAFGIAADQRKGIGGRPAHTVSQRDKVSPNPLGFAAWITKEIPRLKRPTAIKYATAFRSLGLSTAEASPAKIRERIKRMRHEAGKAGQAMPTLGALYKLGKPKGEESANTLPPDSKKLRLEDAREAFHVWKSSGEKLVAGGQLDDLDRAGLEGLKEFLAWMRDRASARLKSI